MSEADQIDFEKEFGWVPGCLMGGTMVLAMIFMGWLTFVSRANFDVYLLATISGSIWMPIAYHLNLFGCKERPGWWMPIGFAAHEFTFLFFRQAPPLRWAR